jgi:hypothetical protein
MLVDILIKSLIGGAVIGVVSTIVQKSPTLGAFLMGIPFVSVITLLMMHYAGVPFETFRTFSYETVLFVALSLVFFPLFVWLYGFGFYIALVSSAVVTGTLMWSVLRIMS